MKPRLVLLFPNGGSSVYPITSATFSVGRDTAGDLAAAIESSVAKLSGFLYAEQSSDAAIRITSNARAATRAALTTQLESMDQIARALNIEDFWMPRKCTDQALISTGHTFAAAAEPLKEQFILQGRPPDFIEGLKAAVAELAGAISSQVDAKASRQAALKEFDKTLAEVLNLLKRLDALVANTMTENPTVMAAWNLARRVERVPVRTAKSVPKPETVPKADSGAKAPSADSAAVPTVAAAAG